MSVTPRFLPRACQRSRWAQLGLATLMMAAGNAWGNCSPTNASANFGSLSSFAVAASPQPTSAQPEPRLSCTEGRFYSNGYLNVRLSSMNAGDLVSVSGDRIGYQIFADAARQQQLQLGSQYGLNPSSGSAERLPLYFRTRPGTASNVAAGSYTDTLTINWSWRVCEGLVLFGFCLGAQDTDSRTSVVSLILEVTPDCAINAPDLDFGSAPLVGSFSPTTRTITIRCTKGESYSVGLSDGGNAQGVQRRMQAGGNYLTYELYKGAGGNQRWGSQGAERRPSSGAEVNPGAADGMNEQGFVVRGEVDPNQPTPPAGTYTDMVVVDVEL